MTDCGSEVWKDIKGYEGLYQASNLGRIKSLKFWSNVHKKYYDREKILKQTHKKGYCYVELYKANQGKDYRVHRLIAETFIFNPENKEEINHCDGNKQNNCVSNLEWATRSENQQHAVKTGLRKVTEKQREIFSLCGKRLAKKVAQYDKQGNFIKAWGGTAEAGRQLQISQGNISECCRGKRKIAGGYIWRYIEEG